MGNRQKVTGRADSVPGGLAAGAAVSVITTAGLTGVMALLLERETISWEGAGYGILVMLMLSAFLGALTACARIRRQWILVSLMSGGVYFGILLSVTALFFGGQYQAVGVTALLVAGGCGCSALLMAGKGRGTRRFR
jgi:hypothetical protein